MADPRERCEQLVASAFAVGRALDPAAELQTAAELKARLSGATRYSNGDRYRLVRRIGAGGAGEVYEAWDEELRRRVAIKVLRPPADPGQADTQARARLVREAQAIARLGHPNVVAVFDVGTCTPAMQDAIGLTGEGAVFVVMEYVDGLTLRDWIERERPPLSTLVEVFAGAARGLAAAHERGIVHRDFKPRNVVVARTEGSRGVPRACVLDFGLARAVPSAYATATTTAHDDTAVLDELTDPGIVLGTPPYMAPEQHRGEPPDPRTDQFAFGVSLWEAVFGERPFRGDTLGELLRAKERPLRLPRRPRIPQWLVRVLRRTLAASPRDRYPSMNLVTRALDRGLRFRRRLLLGVGAAVVAMTGIGVGTRLESTDCDPSSIARRNADVIPPENFTASPTGAEVLPRVREGVTAHVDALHVAAQRACTLPDDGRRSLARMCIDERVARLDAAVAVLAEADATIVEHALALVAELPPPATCTREDLAASPGPVLDAARSRDLLRADVLRSAGKFADAAAMAEVVAAQAEAARDHASLARAGLVLGRVSLVSDGAKPGQAEHRFREALAAAEIAGDDEAAAEALTLLVHTIGPVAGRYAEADPFVQQAEAKLARIGNPPEPTAALASEVGLLRYRQHAYDDAMAAYRRALSLRERLYGAEHPEVAKVRIELGNVFIQLERFDAAQPEYERALAALERAWGPDHPSLSAALEGLAFVDRAHGDPQRAIERLERALALSVAAYGETHDGVAVAASGLGHALQDAGRHAEALPSFDRALAIRLSLLGPDHVAVARARANRASALFHVGAITDAAEELETAVEVLAEELGPDHEAVGMALVNLAPMLRMLGRHEDAAAALTRAVEILDRDDRAPNHAARALASLGVHRADAGDVAAGRDLLERALARATTPAVADPIRSELEGLQAAEVGR